MIETLVQRIGSDGVDALIVRDGGAEHVQKVEVIERDGRACFGSSGNDRRILVRDRAVMGKTRVRACIEFGCVRRRRCDGVDSKTTNARERGTIRRTDEGGHGINPVGQAGQRRRRNRSRPHAIVRDNVLGRAVDKSLDHRGVRGELDLDR